MPPQEQRDDGLVTEENIPPLIRRPIGARLVIKLKASPGTGYLWEADAAPDLVQFDGQPWLERIGVPLPGAMQYQVFTFHTLKAGCGSIRFNLRRSWEASPSVKAKTVAFCFE